VTSPDDPAAALRDLPFTYSERGWTAWSEPPPGYRAAQRSTVLGHGREVFDRAAAALTAWQMHRRAGVDVVATDRTAIVGARVLLRIGVGRLMVSAPCQVVYTVNEDRRRGFAYGTLTGHPECGEESFVVGLGDDEVVVFAIRSFSRPASLTARLGGPLTRGTQRLVTDRYLAALTDLSTAA
jgi:uncharacterized protein (UPF0548 family)